MQAALDAAAAGAGAVPGPVGNVLDAGRSTDEPASRTSAGPDQAPNTKAPTARRLPSRPSCSHRLAMPAPSLRAALRWTGRRVGTHTEVDIPRRERF